MFRKKKLPTHDDTPSVVLAEKEVRTTKVNTEGNVRNRNYRPDPNRPKDTRGTQVVSKSPKEDAYPLPDNEIDVYAVDTRIWERVERYVQGQLDGAGGDAGPHTHTAYALTDHEHDAYVSNGLR